MPDSNSEAQTAAVDCMKAFIEAFNAQDPAAIADTFNFPHIRLANSRFAHIDTAEIFIKGSEAGRPRLEAEGWHHTVMRSCDVIHSGEDKVHLAMIMDRCHEDGEVYNSFDTFWVATLQDGHWGIQFRSSFLR